MNATMKARQINNVLYNSQQLNGRPAADDTKVESTGGGAGTAIICCCDDCCPNERFGSRFDAEYPTNM
jgi:hypothetical protein